MARIIYTVTVYTKNFNSKVLAYGVSSRKKSYDLVKEAFKNKRWIQAQVKTDRGVPREKEFERWIERGGYFIEIPTIGTKELSDAKPCPYCGNEDLLIGHLSAMTVGVECRNKKCGANIGVTLPCNEDLLGRKLLQLTKDMLELAITRWNKRLSQQDMTILMVRRMGASKGKR